MTSSLKVVTVNIERQFLRAIEKLIGEAGLFPSRSELIRRCVQEKLKKEIKKLKSMVKYKDDPQLEEIDEDNFVRVPIENKDKQEFKVYKIMNTLNLPPEEPKNLTMPAQYNKPKVFYEALKGEFVSNVLISWLMHKNKCTTTELECLMDCSKTQIYTTVKKIQRLTPEGMLETLQGSYDGKRVNRYRLDRDEFLRHYNNGGF